MAAVTQVPTKAMESRRRVTGFGLNLTISEIVLVEGRGGLDMKLTFWFLVDF